jgi:hypothetical protein
MGGLVALAILLGLYFLPSILAQHRGVSNVGSIFVINLFLGWTLIGWVVSLAMAVKTVSAPQAAPSMAPTNAPALPTTDLGLPNPGTSDETSLPAPVLMGQTASGVAELAQLAALRERGLLTDEEFSLAKARLLGGADRSEDG